MDKWKKYKSYEGWLCSEMSRLEAEYKEHHDENYNWVEPDTFVSFDSFCMGQWQWL